jgi:hypothetical protein
LPRTISRKKITLLLLWWLLRQQSFEIPFMHALLFTDYVTVLKGSVTILKGLFIYAIIYNIVLHFQTVYFGYYKQSKLFENVSCKRKINAKRNAYTYLFSSLKNTFQNIKDRNYKIKLIYQSF